MAKHKYLIKNNVLMDLNIFKNKKKIIEKFINFYFNVDTYKMKLTEVYCSILHKDIENSYLFNLLVNDENNFIIINMYYDKLLLIILNDNELNNKYNKQEQINLIIHLNSLMLCKFEIDKRKLKSNHPIYNHNINIDINYG
jgi:hypothetical protein